MRKRIIKQRIEKQEQKQNLVLLKINEINQPLSRLTKKEIIPTLLESEMKEGILLLILQGSGGKL